MKSRFWHLSEPNSCSGKWVASSPCDSRVWTNHKGGTLISYLKDKCHVYREELRISIRDPHNPLGHLRFERYQSM